MYINVKRKSERERERFNKKEREWGDWDIQYSTLHQFSGFYSQYYMK